MKTAHLLLLLLTSCHVAVPPARTNDPTVAYFEHALHSTAALLHKNSVFCSGVFIGVRLLTAEHCVDHVEGDEPVTVGLYRDFDSANNQWLKTYEYRVARTSPDNDLALLVPLEITIGLHDSLWVATDLEVGQRVTLVGHSLGIPYVISEGRLSGASRRSRSTTYSLVTAAAYPGNSGGPCIDSEGGLIGVVSFIHVLGPYIGHTLTGCTELGGVQKILTP